MTRSKRRRKRLAKGCQAPPAKRLRVDIGGYLLLRHSLSPDAAEWRSECGLEGELALVHLGINRTVATVSPEGDTPIALPGYPARPTGEYVVAPCPEKKEWARRNSGEQVELVAGAVISVDIGGGGGVRKLGMVCEIPGDGRLGVMFYQYKRGAF